MNIKEIKEMLPLFFYIAGSVCFLIGSILSVIQRVGTK